ncbi:hypothetical protein QFZ78_002674 [Paenibacillus sp. V4I5]|nr:hypothetical protein [Paenibacillus sp. V4I5]
MINSVACCANGAVEHGGNRGFIRRGENSFYCMSLSLSDMREPLTKANIWYYLSGGFTLLKQISILNGVEIVFNKKKILTGILISVILPLIFQSFLTSTTEVKNSDGSVSVISQSLSLTYPSYFIIALCIFVLYLFLLLSWQRLAKNK